MLIRLHGNAPPPPWSRWQPVRGEDLLSGKTRTGARLQRRHDVPRPGSHTRSLSALRVDDISGCVQNGTTGQKSVGPPHRVGTEWVQPETPSRKGFLASWQRLQMHS